MVEIDKIINEFDVENNEGLNYVYLHINDKNKIFYVGKGNGMRYISGHRNKQWIDTVEESEYVKFVKIVENISNDLAKAIEKRIIKEIGKENLTNKSKTYKGKVVSINLNTNELIIHDRQEDAINHSKINRGQIWKVRNYSLPYTKNSNGVYYLFFDLDDYNNKNKIDIDYRIRITKKEIGI